MEWNMAGYHIRFQIYCNRQVLDMSFVFKMIVFPFWLLTAFLALMLK